MMIHLNRGVFMDRKEKEFAKDIATSTRECARKLDDLIKDLERAGVPKETIQKAVDMRDKYRGIADYNEELLDNDELCL